MPTAAMESIQDFLKVHRIALAGVSRNDKDYSRTVLNDLLHSGYDVSLLHPSADTIAGLPCYRVAGEISPSPEAALLLVPENQLLATTKQCLVAGIHHLWYRHSEESSQFYRIAIAEARARGANVVAGECPLMFLPNAAWFHRAHGFINKITGLYPQ